MKRTPLLRRTRLRRVSPKRAMQSRQYRTLRAAFLTERVWCEFPACGKRATEIHHKAGRVGDRYLDVTRWAAMCSCCHRYLTEQPAEAIRLGLSESRLS